MKTVKVVCAYCHDVEVGTREVQETYTLDFTYAEEYEGGQIPACCESCKPLVEENGHHKAITISRKIGEGRWHTGYCKQALTNAIEK